MLKSNWLIWPSLLIWLIACCHNFIVYGQSENAIGAYRHFQKTSFSCSGRPAGYYADIETGCQVYHMCDGLGRQFSYSCPNTTLFQQRMLVCDHWYMVNCSRAESDYAANLLIGQRDKPFVNDEETNFRTPRPDLLDRPYAPDYSGESFRNQYKQVSAPQNQLLDNDAHKNLNKVAPSSQQQLNNGQQRWKIPPPPSRNILPPAFEPQILEQPSNTNRPIAQPTQQFKTTQRPKTIKQQTVVSTLGTSTTSRPTQFNKAPLLQRHSEEDLGTSHSTRYNTSADLNSVEDISFSRKSSLLLSTTPATITSRVDNKTSIKVPSKIYEPPFLYPIYNQNETLTPSTETPLEVSTAAPFATRAPSSRLSVHTTYTPSRPTTLAGKPFMSALAATAVPNAGRNQNKLLQNNFQASQRFDAQKLFGGKDLRTPAPAQGFKPPTPLPPVGSSKSTPDIENSPFDYTVPSSNNRLNITPNEAALPPAKELLPPMKDFVQHDIATTQGPPIYYEWKIPSNGLEPPKLDPPIGVDGREYSDTITDYNAISGASSTKADKDSSTAQSTIFSGNILTETASKRTPTQRAVKDTAQPNGFEQNFKQSKPAITDILQLRKQLSVPEYSFPLEEIGRTGYLATNTYNSFQLKIPERRSDSDVKLHWFGENPECPECHPSFVKPGSCEPCFRRR